MMKLNKSLMLLALALFSVACVKDDGPAAGKAVGQLYVSSAAGSKNVLVSLPGLWRVTPVDDWIEVDVDGRNGEGAFTINYGSNESDFVETKATRRGAIVITDYLRKITDTLYVLQQGTPDGKEYSSAPQDSYIEFLDTKLTKMKAAYVSFKGSSDVTAAANWIKNSDYDIVAVTWITTFVDELCSALTYGSVKSAGVAVFNKKGYSQFDKVASTSQPPSVAACADGINFHVADLDRSKEFQPQMVTVLDNGYNMPGVSSKWVIGGTFFYLSAMEIGYSDTPSWYPTDPEDSAFDADRYVQNNLLTDCVWMTSRKYNPTFADNGQNWRADYVYMSNSVWNNAIDVKICDKPLSNALHNVIEMKIQY